MKQASLLRKTSRVPTREVVPASSLAYNPRYAVPRKLTLSKAFDVVNEKNRFLSLELMLKRFSGHVGRRQYKMQCNISKYLEELQELGIDWHELKFLPRDDLMELLNKQLQLSQAEKAVLLTALDAKLCGVLRQSTARHSTNVCMNSGKADHGWRCGLHGHTNDVYFEGKQCANSAALQLAHRSFLREAVRDGIRVDVRSEPDFSVVGRRQEQLNPRVWSTPESTHFIVSPIGFEFRVHPDDPRAHLQIEAAAAEWELHAHVVQQVTLEMLELYGVERAPQPLSMRPTEMGPPDIPQTYSSAFTSKVPVGGPATEAPVGNDDAGEEVVVEQRMVDVEGVERPWFQTPLEQQYTPENLPRLLPFAPSIVVKTTYRQVQRQTVYDDVTSQLMQPVLDVALYVHPSACFWWNAENEERCVKHILDYAKRVPFALPFNLYFRVDTTKEARLHPELEVQKAALIESKAAWFDLRQFRAVHGAARAHDDAANNASDDTRHADG